MTKDINTISMEEAFTKALNTLDQYGGLIFMGDLRNAKVNGLSQLCLRIGLPMFLVNKDGRLIKARLEVFETPSVDYYGEFLIDGFNDDLENIGIVSVEEYNNLVEDSPVLLMSEDQANINFIINTYRVNDILRYKTPWNRKRRTHRVSDIIGYKTPWCKEKEEINK